MTSADLLLHPVRLRIVKAFLGDEALTVKQLAADLPDVALGSLYRHVSRLADAGVLQVVAERRVRATTERTYALRMYAAQMQPSEIAAMTLDEHVTAFLAYIAGLLGDFDRYIATEPEHPGEDGAGYKVAALWLTDAELAKYLREFSAITQPRLAHRPDGERRRRMLFTVLLPATDSHHGQPSKQQPTKRRRQARTKEGKP